MRKTNLLLAIHFASLYSLIQSVYHSGSHFFSHICAPTSVRGTQWEAGDEMGRANGLGIQSPESTSQGDLSPTS